MLARQLLISNYDENKSAHQDLVIERTLLFDPSIITFKRAFAFYLS